MEHFKADQSWTFLRSLDWSEPWIFLLISLYLVFFASLYLTRRNSAIQSFTFVLMLLIVYMAEDINQYLAFNHKFFTKHQYFDSSGMFISMFMSTPLLLACAFVVANWFYMSSQLMAQVRLAHMQRMQKKMSKHPVHEDEEDEEEEELDGLQPRPTSTLAQGKKKKRKSE